MLSVIIPVYNVLPYLEKCCESVALSSAGIEACEVILVDDGSTDGSGEWCDRFCETHPRFRCLHKENGGLMAAWMDGLQAARGTYIGFVDSDDYVSDTMFTDLYGKAVANDADIVLCNHYYDATADGGQLSLCRNPLQEGLYVGADWDAMKHRVFPHIGQDYVSPSRCNKLIRRTLLEKNLCYCDTRISSAEDVNIMVPCLLSCQRLYYRDVPHYYYVRRTTSISHVFKPSVLDSYTVLLNSLARALTDTAYPDNDEWYRLWNFYGYLWVWYTVNASLPFFKKAEQIKRLSQQDTFIAATKVLTPDLNSRVYGYTVRYRLGILPLLYFGIKRLIHRLLRR